MEDDTLIPVEHDGSAKSMSGTVLGNYVYGVVEDNVETIAGIIATGPQGPDGVSPTLSSSKTGKVTTIYYTDADHPTPTVLATLTDGLDGTGIGDMLKSVYDQDDDGVVDNAAKLGGQGPDYYISANEKDVTIPTLDENGLTQPKLRMFYAGYNVGGGTLSPSSANARTMYFRGANSTITISAQTVYDYPFEVKLVRWDTYSMTIKGENGVIINGVNGGTFNIQHQYKSATLRLISNNSPGSTWHLEGDI